MLEQFRGQRTTTSAPPRECKSGVAPPLHLGSAPELAELTTPAAPRQELRDDAPDVAAALRCRRSADRLTMLNLTTSAGYQILLGSALVAQSAWMLSCAVSKPLWGPYLDGGAGIFSAVVGYFSIRFGANLTLSEIPDLIARRSADRMTTSVEIEEADALLRYSPAEGSEAAHRYLAGLAEGGARRTVRALAGITRVIKTRACADEDVPTILRSLAELLPGSYRGLPIQQELAENLLSRVNSILRSIASSSERAATAEALAILIGAGMGHDPILARTAAVGLMDHAREIPRGEILSRARLLSGAWWLTTRSDPLRENLELQLREIGATLPASPEETGMVRAILQRLGIKG